MLPLETKHFYSQLICFSVLSYFIVLRKKNNLKTFQILLIPYKLKKKKTKKYHIVGKVQKFTWQNRRNRDKIDTIKTHME